jgi:hypothetical protein
MTHAPPESNQLKESLRGELQKFDVTNRRLTGRAFAVEHFNLGDIVRS